MKDKWAGEGFENDKINASQNSKGMVFLWNTEFQKKLSELLVNE